MLSVSKTHKVDRMLFQHRISDPFQPTKKGEHNTYQPENLERNHPLDEYVELKTRHQNHKGCSNIFFDPILGINLQKKHRYTPWN